MGIEAALQGLQQGAAQEAAKLKKTADDVPLLTNEIDRKLGTMLMDIDQKLQVARADSRKDAEAAVQAAAERSSAAQAELRERIDATEANLASSDGNVQQALEANRSLER